MRPPAPGAPDDAAKIDPRGMGRAGSRPDVLLVAITGLVIATMLDYVAPGAQIHCRPADPPAAAGPGDG